MDKKVIDILKTLNPVSIFVYGSQANQCKNSKSDYEIGVIFKDSCYISRQEIKNKVSDNNYNIFPFKLTEIKNCNIDTPFQKSIYIASLTSGNAKTIFGKKIIENLEPVKILKQDLLMDTSFNLGYALSAVRLMKENLLDLANEFLYKSMLFATRNLYYSKYKVLISGYVNIFNQAKKLDIPNEYKELLTICYKLRVEKPVKIDSSLYYKNISYINKFVIPSIERLFVD